jgi:hypothetical protein
MKGWILGTALIASSADAAVLANPDQIALDLHAVQILNLPEVQAEKAALRALYEADPQAATPDGRARMEKPLDAIMFNSVLNAVANDPDRPKIYWDGCAPHDWNGTSIPASGYGIDNPDNVYRQVAIDGAARYEIAGKVTASSPAQLSFVLYRTLPGGPANASQVREGAPVLGALIDHDIKTGPDGAFTITIDSDPAGDRPNHIRSGDGADEILIIRDTLADWTTQQPTALIVRRVGGPPPKPVPSDSEITKRAIDLMRAMVPFWLKYDRDFIFPIPVNTLGPLQKRDGGWGYATIGHFALAPDEAMVVTVEPLAAKYLGFQVTDLWSVAPDYIHHQSSLNGRQARPNPDGSYTYVIAATDPGVANWIDTVGLHAGMMAVRWQALPDPNVDAAHAVREMKIVKLKDLSDMPRVSPDDRRKALAQRVKDYTRRLGSR